MYKRHSYQNGVPTIDTNPYVQWEGLYVQYNPFIPKSFNHPQPLPPPQGLCHLLEKTSAGNSQCTPRQETQMCRTVVTDQGPLCAGYGATVDVRKGTASKACVI